MYDIAFWINTAFWSILSVGAVVLVVQAVKRKRHPLCCAPVCGEKADRRLAVLTEEGAESFPLCIDHLAEYGVKLASHRAFLGIRTEEL